MLPVLNSLKSRLINESKRLIEDNNILLYNAVFSSIINCIHHIKNINKNKIVLDVP